MGSKLAEVTAAAPHLRAVQQSGRRDVRRQLQRECVAGAFLAQPDSPTAPPNSNTRLRPAPAGGQTALYDAIAKALEELQAGSRDKKVLIVRQ